MGRCPQTRSMVDTELEVNSLHEPGFFLGTSMAAQLLPAGMSPSAPVAAGPAPDSGPASGPDAGLGALLRATIFFSRWNELQTSGWKPHRILVPRSVMARSFHAPRLTPVRAHSSRLGSEVL